MNAGLRGLRKILGRRRFHAQKRSHCEAGGRFRSGLQLTAGDEVRELHDVGRKEVDRPGHFLSRPCGILSEQRGGDEALKLFKKAVENCKPLLGVKTRRVGGANYQVPIEVNPERRTSLSIRWLVTYEAGPVVRRG